jgi:hypothetical protein
MNSYKDPGGEYVESTGTGHWSGSYQTLYRIHEILMSINNKKRYNDVGVNLATDLEVLYDEIYPFLKDDEKKEAQKLIANVGNAIAENDKVPSHYRGGNVSQELQLANKLLNRFLRDMLYRYDLLMKKAEDTSERY